MPAHNESDNLRWLLPHVSDVLPRIAERFNVIVVDDASTDGTGETARSVAGELGLDLKVVRREQMAGMGAALGAGLREADLEFTAFIDADGQLDPSDLSLLIPLLNDFDLVAGWRLTREDPAFRSVISTVFNRLVLMAFRLRVKDVDCALKIIRTDMLRRFDLRAHSALINAELYWKVGLHGGRYTQVGVPHHPRRMGRRSGGRLKPILRATRELVEFRFGELRNR
jgi:glycosyltransferase involved in cell wall biosynthesis